MSSYKCLVTFSNSFGVRLLLKGIKSSNPQSSNKNRSCGAVNNKDHDSKINVPAVLTAWSLGYV